MKQEINWIPVTSNKRPRNNEIVIICFDKNYASQHGTWDMASYNAETDTYCRTDEDFDGFPFYHVAYWAHIDPICK